MAGMTCVEDLRKAARRRVPRAFNDYLEAGSYAEQTLRANRADLERITLKQRVLVDVEQRDTATTILGEKVSLPVALAPIGLGGMQWADGEILACRAAKTAGVPYTMSTMSICSIEDVAEAVDYPFWFQLYVMKDRGFVRSLVERAIAGRCGALVLTVDLQVLGQRHADVRNGLSVPPALKLRTILDIAAHPAWAARMLTAKRWTFGNLAGHLKGEDDVRAVADWVAHQFDATLNWSDVEWIRSIWPGKLIVKGLLNTDDARSACAAGADAIVVSNHGGRQLDGAPSTISMLPRIAEAVGSEAEVLFDGGVRSGQDVMRALALGARACLVGRAYVYGLAAGGEAGVATAIDILHKELSVTMALTGTRSVNEIDGRVLN
ncbi:alpha-hydroxy acid oxidase [Mesorhizobium sp. M2C.T.Ca.TU.002.02.1.1]|uniref:alpha-hydroxy acid oxidase n=1 Tax=Mesorhizobium sp. M2C.T.Ca.TU.002.02.1.1 TaxID=2496788 RepID=UPI000FCB7895|nr:alpha-hydroxy acid oxidase [Mesorhizobium sp. M2C.T.Ca.TU.002.02.1.1]RUU55440.1 alpha-hydroxy-acid oxidizing protein [Mesorhizobium sp. M2C.T.Ca.TU.002.02.1.1]